jgi:hypothetical protein
MKTRLTDVVVGLLLSVFAARLIHAADTVPVTVDNFIVPSQIFISAVFQRTAAAPMGKFNHGRDHLEIR